jgi:hypothetical protein
MPLAWTSLRPCEDFKRQLDIAVASLVASSIPLGAQPRVALDHSGACERPSARQAAGTIPLSMSWKTAPGVGFPSGDPSALKSLSGTIARSALWRTTIGDPR